MGAGLSQPGIHPKIGEWLKGDPQHSLQWHRRSSAVWPCLRIMRRDQRQQTTPRNNHVHFRQKLLAQCRPLHHRIAKVRKSRLRQDRRSPLRVAVVYQFRPEGGGSPAFPKVIINSP